MRKFKKSLAHGQVPIDFLLARSKKSLAPGVGQSDLSAPVHNLIHFVIYQCFISTGEIAPVGPTSFEFVVPEGSPLTISPSVGTIEPGKVYLIIVILNIMKICNSKD